MMGVRTVLLVGLLLLGTLAVARPAAAPAAPTRWAVIVGVNDYEAYASVEEGDLRGAVNDARSMHEVLVRRWGFPEENVVLLLDGDATRAGIREALTEWLPSRVRPGDVALFFFAGHGAQALDMDGDEEDGLDETIAPADVLPTSSELDITDDELSAWMDAIPSDFVTVILDSCHSGTGTRLLTPQVRPRALSRPLPEGVERPGTRGDEAGAGNLTRALVEGPGIVELAAAAPDQSAMDAIFPGGTERPNYAGGAFTTHLVRQLWQAAPGTEYGAVFQATVEAMKADRFTQDPQFNGTRGVPVFGLVDAGDEGLAQGEVAVVSHEEDQVVLSSGASLGVTVGSLYETRSGALLRVTRVRDGDALARPLAGGADRIGGTARLVAAALPDAELVVDGSRLPAPVRDALAGRLRSVHAVTLVGGEEAADLFVAPAADEAALEIRSRDGGLRARVDGSGPEAAPSLAEALRQEVAAQRLAVLSNPVAGSPVELEMVGEPAALELGDRIAFRVRSGRSGYLTLVDLGTDGTVTILYPNRWVPEGALPGGEWLEIPTRDMGFAMEASPPAGWGMVRALVTEEPLRLELGGAALLQNENGEALASDVLRALRAEATRGWSRDASLDGALPLAGWSTALVNYRIHE